MIKEWYEKICYFWKFWKFLKVLKFLQKSSFQAPQVLSFEIQVPTKLKNLQTECRRSFSYAIRTPAIYKLQQSTSSELIWCIWNKLFAEEDIWKAEKPQVSANQDKRVNQAEFKVQNRKLFTSVWTPNFRKFCFEAHLNAVRCKWSYNYRT